MFVEQMLVKWNSNTLQSSFTQALKEENESVLVAFENLIDILDAFKAGSSNGNSTTNG